MKDLIRKILKEESEDEFDWVPKEFDLVLGDQFNQSDICDKSFGSNCKIYFDDENFTIYLDFEDWTANFIDIEDYDVFYLRNLLLNYTPYNDYDLEEDEFNYMGRRLNDVNIKKLNYLLGLLGLDKSAEQYISGDELNDLFTEFELIKPIDGLISDVVSEVSEALNTNRWNSLKDYLNNKINESGADFNLNHRDAFIITIPAEIVLKQMSEGSNLTSIVKEISEWLSETSWSNEYYDTFDTTGSEIGINQLIEDYLDELLEEVENQPNFSDYKEFLELLTRFGFIKISEKAWSKQIGDNEDNLMHIGVTNIDMNKRKFKLVTSIHSMKHRDKKYESILDFDQLGDVMHNYKLDLD